MRKDEVLLGSAKGCIYTSSGMAELCLACGVHGEAFSRIGELSPIRVFTASLPFSNHGSQSKREAPYVLSSAHPKQARWVAPPQIVNCRYIKSVNSFWQTIRFI